MAQRRFGLWSLSAVTTALIFVLILLGVYTAWEGAGLTCGGRWPFCDGFLGLFPATLPSFWEWLHRFVAMITGFFILGTTLVAWRRYPGQARLKWATAIALIVLPLQVIFGGMTVLFFRGDVIIAHHGAALIIFGAMIVASLDAYDLEH